MNSTIKYLQLDQAPKWIFQVIIIVSSSTPNNQVFKVEQLHVVYIGALYSWTAVGQICPHVSGYITDSDDDGVGGQALATCVARTYGGVSRTVAQVYVAIDEYGDGR